MSNVLALNGEIAPAPTVGVLQRGVLRRPVELTTQYPPRLVVQGRWLRATFCRTHLQQKQ